MTEILEDLARQLIEKAYDKAGGVKTSARVCRVKTSALYYKLEKYGIGTVAPRGAGGPGGATEAAGTAGSTERLIADGPALIPPTGGDGETDR